MSKKTKWIIILIVAVLFLIFLLQNTQVVTLHFYFWKIAMSQIILIPLAVLLGFVLGLLFKGRQGRRKAKQP